MAVQKVRKMVAKMVALLDDNRVAQTVIDSVVQMESHLVDGLVCGRAVQLVSSEELALADETVVEKVGTMEENLVYLKAAW